MKEHLKTVRQYAEMEGIGVAAVYLRIKRKKLKSKLIDDRIYVYVNSDISIKKPRRKIN